MATELKPLASAGGKSKADFVKNAGKPRVLQAPRKGRARKLSDSSTRAIKLMLFGPPGAGKSYFLVGLLKHGLKVLVITTDLGGDGLTTVELQLRRENLQHLLENAWVIELRGDEEVQSFLKEPAAFLSDVYDLDIDVLVWEGFSSWQLVDLSEAVGDDIVQRAADSKGVTKIVSDQRAAGNLFEKQDWGIVRNATARAVDQFCSLNNKKTGQVWHKVVTCHEAYKSKEASAGGGFVETRLPLLSGQGGLLSNGAFDLIIRTVVRTARDEDDAGKRIFEYVVQGNQTNAAKSRGFDLPPVIPADPYELWKTITTQLGIQGKIVDERWKDEILVSGEMTNE